MYLGSKFTMEEQVDAGNFDWYFKTDDDGNVWITPSLGWEDGEVYESVRDGREIYWALERADVL